MKRVLFFAEAVTLAHVARPIVLASGLDERVFEPIVACHPRSQRFLQGKPWQTLPLQSIDSAQFLASLARGSPVFDAPTLRRYVREDLALINRVKPDLVVGDFRISLAVSARLAGVPYLTVTNAYWSPFGVDQAFPLPQLPMTRVLPIRLAAALFRGASPLAMRVHCRPMNSVRVEHGLEPLGSDLRRVYTDADWTLYADARELFPTRELPPTHRFLGPLLWSPPVPQPPWWDALPGDRPIVYLTLGSSGHPRTLQTVLAALRDLPVTVMVSTAGSPLAGQPPANVRVADYLDGTVAAARSSLVICNGGSPTSQQALAAGVPVLCIPSNADQFLNAAALVNAGCGLQLRADRLTARHVKASVRSLLSSPAARESARAMQAVFARYRPQEDFLALATEICSPGAAAPGAQAGSFPTGATLPQRPGGA